MSPHLFLLYCLTWSLVALIPGPAVMCAMAQSTRCGVRASLAGILGIQLGNLLFFVCVAFGLAALLAKASVAFSVLRTVGALYLFYLGGRIILRSFRTPATQSAPAAAPAVVRRHLFLQGLLIQLTNPKALLFFSALLPQFMEPQRSVLWQLGILAAATIAVDTAVLSSYAFVAQRGVQSLQRTRLSAALERAYGAVLVCFGCRLLLDRK